MRRSIARFLEPSSRRFVSASAPARPPGKKKNNPATPTTTTGTTNSSSNSKRDSLILQRFKLRQLEGTASSPVKKSTTPSAPRLSLDGGNPFRPPQSPSPAETGDGEVVSGFGELGLSEELVAACKEVGMVVPSEVQCVGIPEVLKGSSLVMSSRSGISRTLAYLLPLLQLLRKDSALCCVERQRPRAIVLCGSAEQCDRVFETAKYINEHAHTHSAGRSANGRDGGDRQLSPSTGIGMLVGTPDEIVRQIDDADVAVADMKYLVVDEVDILLHSPCFAAILKRLSKLHFQTILVTSPISKVLEKNIVEPLERDHSGEVAAMILEVGPDEAISLMETPRALKNKLSEAVESFNTSKCGS